MHSKYIESDSKDFYNVTNISIWKKNCSFELSIHQTILKKKIISWFPQKY